MHQGPNLGIVVKILAAVAMSVVLGGIVVRAQEPAPANPSSGPAQAVASSGNTVEILTPVGGVDFSSYISRVVAAVKKNWYAAMPPEVYSGARGKTAIVFKIQKDGQLQDISVESSSGDDLLDRAAVKGIRDSGPLDALPKDFKGPNIELRFSFFYNLKPPGAAQRPAFDCAGTTTPAETPQFSPFDRLELLAFVAGESHPAFAERAICQRGINFSPDSTFLSSLQLNGVAANFTEGLNKVKPKTITESTPDRVSAYLLLDRALSDRREGKFASASENYVRASNLAPDSATLRLAYARNLLSEHKYSEAETQLRQSLEIWPGNAVAHTLLAVVLTAQNRDSDAVPEAREALRIFPGDTTARVELGIGLARSGNYREAVPVLRESIYYATQTPAIYKVLGGSLVHMGQFDEAITELRLFLKTNPNDAETHYLVGVALRGKGNSDEALAEFREATRINPDNPLYSANVNLADPKETETAGLKSMEPRPDDGFFAGSVYTNTFFNFSYEYPKGWNVLKSDRGQAVDRLGGSLIANGDPVFQDEMEAGVKNTYQLLVVAETSTKEVSTLVNWIQLQALTTRLGPNMKSGEDFLKGVVQYWQQHSGAAISVVEPPTQLTIDGKTLWRIRLDSRVNGNVAHAIEFATIEKGYVVLFSFASRDESKVRELAGTIQSLRFTDPSH